MLKLIAHPSHRPHQLYYSPMVLRDHTFTVAFVLICPGHRQADCSLFPKHRSLAAFYVGGTPSWIYSILAERPRDADP